MNSDEAILPENERQVTSRLLMVKGREDFCAGNPKLPLHKVNKRLDKASVHDVPPYVNG